MVANDSLKNAPFRVIILALRDLGRGSSDTFVVAGRVLPACHHNGRLFGALLTCMVDHSKIAFG